MPDDRLIHRRCGRSEKVSGLSDFEFRVWVQYELSADDFGVLLRSVARFQGDNAALERRSVRAIDRALDRLREVGLVDTFQHQRDWYLFQRDWQDYQKIKHARHTVQPFPPADALARCSEKTRALFLEQHNHKPSAEVLEDFSNPSAEVSPLARAGTRETATATANGQRLEANGQRPTAARGSALMGGSYAAHAKHGACNDRGLCVPKFLHDEFVAKANGDAAHVAAFYEATLDALPLDAIPGEDPLVFWRTAWKQAHGPSQTLSTSKTAGNVAALQAFVKGGQS